MKRLIRVGFEARGSCRRGATLFMVLLAGFQAFLSRLSGAAGLAVGSPFATRDHRELEGVVGPLLNTLVMRGDLAGDPSFRDLLARVREDVIAAHERSDLPFELLVERLRPGRQAGENPLFRAMLVFHRPPAPVRAGQVRMEPEAVPTRAAKLDLTLYAVEWAGGMTLELEHAGHPWSRAAAAVRLVQLAALLSEVAGDPGRRLSELLAGIWEDVLGVERPGRHDDFFAMAASPSSRPGW